MFLGNPQGSHTVRTARELILDSFNNKDNHEDGSSENKINEKDSTKKTVKGKDGMKVIDIGDNQTISFFDASVRNAKMTGKKASSEKMMMVRIKEQEQKI